MTDREMIESLRSTVCPGCDSDKPEGKSFCRRCYFSLPKQLRSDLYRRYGQGYQQAFIDAMAQLKGGAA